MKTIILFLLFFVVFPIFITSLRALRTFLSGPQDDSLYSQQMYEESHRRAVRELAITYTVFIVLSGIAILVILNN